MSQTISTCYQIHNSPLNSSPSKALYTFPKDSRFKHTKDFNCSTAFYDLPSPSSKRKAGIGYGSKYDFTKYGSKTPAPSQYEAKSIFQSNSKQGKSFGLSREQLSGQGIMANLKTSGQIPGPGSYNKPSTISNIKFSMRTKGSNIFSKSGEMPGPGQYTTLPSINGSGKYPLSKYKSYGTTVISPSSSQRFDKNLGDKVPGAQYQSIDQLNKEGKYVVSKHRSAQVRSFSHGLRDTLALGGKMQTPGPGSYRLPSDFGHYSSKNTKS